MGVGSISGTATFTQITTNTDDIKQVYCGASHNFILKNDGTLWICGYNGNGNLGLGDTSYRTTFTQVTTNADNIKSICCGCHFTLVLKNDGTLW